MIRLLFVLAVAIGLTACPDKTEEIGGAPKRQLDHVQDSVDRASQKVEDRLNKAAEAAEE